MSETNIWIWERQLNHWSYRIYWHVMLLSWQVATPVHCLSDVGLWSGRPLCLATIHDQLATCDDGRQGRRTVFDSRGDLFVTAGAATRLEWLCVIGALLPTRMTLTCHWRHSVTWRTWLSQSQSVVSLSSSFTISIFSIISSSITTSSMNSPRYRLRSDSVAKWVVFSSVSVRLYRCFMAK